MLKTPTAAAIALAATFAFGGTANAAGCLNCGYYNGVSLNGVQINGQVWNGTRVNGTKMSGTPVQNSELSGGMQILSIELPATR